MQVPKRICRELGGKIVLSQTQMRRKPLPPLIFLNYIAICTA